jgi:hypothetical protein
VPHEGYFRNALCSLNLISTVLLNSDVHQFHQYQKTEQSPLIFKTHWAQRKPTTYDVRNPDPDFGTCIKMDALVICLFLTQT